MTLEHMHELIDKYRGYLSTEASLKAFLHSDEIRDKWINLFESWVKQLFEMQFTDASHFVNVQNDIGHCGIFTSRLNLLQQKIYSMLGI